MSLSYLARAGASSMSRTASRYFASHAPAAAAAAGAHGHGGHGGGGGHGEHGHDDHGHGHGHGGDPRSESHLFGEVRKRGRGVALARARKAPAATASRGASSIAPSYPCARARARARRAPTSPVRPQHPPHAGGPRAWGEWEAVHYATMAGIVLIGAGALYRSNTNPHDWARDEASRALRGGERGEIARRGTARRMRLRARTTTRWRQLQGKRLRSSSPARQSRLQQGLTCLLSRHPFPLTRPAGRGAQPAARGGPAGRVRRELCGHSLHARARERDWRGGGRAGGRGARGARARGVALVEQGGVSGA